MIDRSCRCPGCGQCNSAAKLDSAKLWVDREITKIKATIKGYAFEPVSPKTTAAQARLELLQEMRAQL